MHFFCRKSLDALLRIHFPKLQFETALLGLCYDSLRCGSFIDGLSFKWIGILGYEINSNDVKRVFASNIKCKIEILLSYHRVKKKIDQDYSSSRMFSKFVQNIVLLAQKPQTKINRTRFCRQYFGKARFNFENFGL